MKLILIVLIICIVYVKLQIIGLEVKTVGFTFSPNSGTVKQNESIRFIIGTTHNVAQVTSVNSTTKMIGGFYSGSPVNSTTTYLYNVSSVTGTFYYICEPHINQEMSRSIYCNYSKFFKCVKIFNWIFNVHFNLHHFLKNKK